MSLIAICASNSTTTAADSEDQCSDGPYLPHALVIITERQRCAVSDQTVVARCRP